MASMRGKIDMKGLENFQKSLEKLNNTQRQQWNEATIKELAGRLLAKVIKRTPVGKPPRPEKSNRTVKVTGTSGKTKSFLSADEVRYQQYWSGYKGGTLRRGWTGGKDIDPYDFANSSKVMKSGNDYIIIIKNPVEYAPYVEFGHRQTPGRFVPAIGKRLKSSWVEGKFMLTVSEQELQSEAPRIIEQKLQKFLEEAFK